MILSIGLGLTRPRHHRYRLTPINGFRIAAAGSLSVYANLTPRDPEYMGTTRGMGHNRVRLLRYQSNLKAYSNKSHFHALWASQ